jgi:hypothetical protein
LVLVAGAAHSRRDGAAPMAASRYAEAKRCFRIVLGIEPDNLNGFDP